MGIVVSAKIPEDLKKKADKYGIKIGITLRESLERKVMEAEREVLAARLDEIRDGVGAKIRRGDVTKAVRESRDER